jgi:hypothetical protein
MIRHWLLMVATDTRRACIHCSAHTQGTIHYYTKAHHDFGTHCDHTLGEVLTCALSRHFSYCYADTAITACIPTSSHLLHAHDCTICDDIADTGELYDVRELDGTAPYRYSILPYNMRVPSKARQLLGINEQPTRVPSKVAKVTAYFTSLKLL